MEAEYWHSRWKQRLIGFDQVQPNPLLTSQFERLNVKQGARIFVPLTGKTIDVAWLLDQNYKVVGVELNETAVVELFALLKKTPTITKVGKLLLYSSDSIEIFVGDLFDVDESTLGEVDAVYDRASIVALPPEMRRKYAKHLLRVTNAAMQLVITFEYDQELMPGPPFSVAKQELMTYYSDSYTIENLQSNDLPFLLKGKAEAKESAWLLK